MDVDRRRREQPHTVVPALKYSHKSIFTRADQALTFITSRPVFSPKVSSINTLPHKQTSSYVILLPSFQASIILLPWQKNCRVAKKPIAPHFYEGGGPGGRSCKQNHFSTIRCSHEGSVELKNLLRFVFRIAFRVRLPVVANHASVIDGATRRYFSRMSGRYPRRFLARLSTTLLLGTGKTDYLTIKKMAEAPAPVIVKPGAMQDLFHAGAAA